MPAARKKNLPVAWPSAQEQRAMMAGLAKRPDLIDYIAELQATSPDPFAVAKKIRVENWRWTNFLHRPENKELLARYEWSDKAYAKELVHKAIDVADECDEETGVAKARLQGDRYLQVAGFYDSDRFGKKLEVKHQHTVSVDAGLVGRIGDLLASRRREIDVTPSENCDVAQLAARGTHNPEVGGSSPPVATGEHGPQAQSGEKPARAAIRIPSVHGDSGEGAAEVP